MDSSNNMIQQVGTVSVFVNDQDRAKQFYTRVLGFELRADEPLFPGAEARWLAVAPQGADTEIVLYVPDENWSHYETVVGKAQAITLTVSDMQRTYATLKDRGVNFIEEPEEQSWGTYAIIEDSEGNRLILSEES